MNHRSRTDIGSAPRAPGRFTLSGRRLAIRAVGTTRAAGRIALTGRRLVALAVGTALAVGSGLIVDRWTAPNALALPPFPIIDMEDGRFDPVKWSTTGSTGLLGRTHDGWMRVADGRTNLRANMLTREAFPSTTGLSVTFDYRIGAVSLYGGVPGDGLSVYLVDGAQTDVSPGGAGGGLSYARVEGSNGAADPGVLGGYLGVGIDAFGSFARNNEGRSGGDPSLVGRPAIGIRGSGNGHVPVGASTGIYPWVKGAALDGLVTSTTINADPKDSPTSHYRRVRITMQPTDSEQHSAVEVWISPLTTKDSQPDSMVRVLATDLENVAGQGPMPGSLKLGIGASTGAASAFMDVKNVHVEALTDAAVAMRINTPGIEGFDPPAFAPGQKVSLTLAAVNKGPSPIVDDLDGAAVLYSDLSEVFDAVTWTCAGKKSGLCETAHGSDPEIRAPGWGMMGARITVHVTGTIRSDITPGVYELTALIPTDLENNALDPGTSQITSDGSLSDTDLGNNTATLALQIPDRGTGEKEAPPADPAPPAPPAPTTSPEPPSPITRPLPSRLPSPPPITPSPLPSHVPNPRPTSTADDGGPSASPTVANKHFAAQQAPEGRPDAVTSSLAVPTGQGTTTVVADGRAWHRAEVTVRDARGNPLAGITAQVTLRAQAGRLVQTLTTSPSDAQGIAQVEFASPSTRSFTVSATIVVDGQAQEVTDGSPTRAEFMTWLGGGATIRRS
ncbi:MAG: Ig-like domain-containing protein [Micrococcales bacterium]|nr:Ig-like domain-containing protein [Micrococcales bacterium]